MTTEDLRRRAPGAPGDRVRPLADRTLARLAARLSVPTYDRSALVPAVVHVGVGGFHRAHQLLYFDDLAQRRISAGWGVVGISLRRRALRDALAAQDHLYTVVQRDAAGEQARVVGALVGHHAAPDGPGTVQARLADPRTRLVTLTVTGGAYAPDPAPGGPRTVFGHLADALARRRAAGVPPFAVLSCDNLPRNGDSARAAVLACTRPDPALTRWVEDTVAFPNGVVDRITPEPAAELRASVAAAYGVADRCPVATEPFSQWVIEDAAADRLPPLDRVGARFVPDVTRYELMKTRLLNAAHSALGHLGRLAGHRRTDEVLADPVFAGYLTRLLAAEVGPLLTPPDGVDLAGYQRGLLTRLANPAIGDQLDRLCGRGSTKMPDYLLPSLHQALREGRPCELLTLAVAGWIRYLGGTAGEVRDPLRDTLVPLARAAGTDPRPLLALRPLFGDLGARPDFVAGLAGALDRLDRDGVRPTVAAYCADDLPVPA